MSHDAWEILVAKYADGRPLCNCKEAYYTPCGKGIDGSGMERTDMLACQYGCSANKIFTRDEIAEKILKDFEHQSSTPAHPAKQPEAEA